MKQYEFDSNKYYFDEEAASRVINFFEKMLVHVRGPLTGKPFLLEQWQKDILSEIFGIKHKSTGFRKYTRAYIELPRKSGKSLMCAGIALYMLVADGEPGAEIYSCAGDHDQAKIVFGLAKDMVELSPLLSKILKVHRSTIYLKRKGKVTNKYQAVTSKAGTKHGTNPSCVVYDELHEAPNGSLYEAFSTGLGARSQPLMIVITTAGSNKDSICYELHQYSKHVADGLIPDETWYSAIYGAGPDDDWTDPEVWKKCNPNYGVSVQKSFFETEFKKAKDSPRQAASFRRLYLNQWVDVVDGWLDTLRWRELRVDKEMPSGQEVYLGLDVATKYDLTALSMVFKLENGEFYTKQHFYCPKDVDLKKRGKSKQMDYSVWADNGYLRLNDGQVTDFDYILADIDEIAKKYKVKAIVVDPSHAGPLIQTLSKKGYQVIELAPQNVRRMSGTCLKFEELIMEGKIFNDGNPVMNWMIGNVTPSFDAYDNITIKKSAATEKIDGVVATILALDRALYDTDREFDENFFTFHTV